MEFVGSLIVVQHTGIGEGAAPNSALRCHINYGASALSLHSLDATFFFFFFTRLSGKGS
jgi:hypothetical protein